jgi:CRP/FNR family transcriptional regulator, cyclic AMP receptor protein
MIMDLAEGLGYLASGLVVGTFCMETMMPLRIVAIGSNFAFIAYSLAEGLLPILVLHSILLPLNALRLVQMQKLLRRMQEAAQGDLALEGLLPFMSRRKVKRGEILFRKDQLAHEMFYVLAGEIRLQELGRTIGPGTVLGEISMFSPDRRRTATAVCATDGELLAMTADQVRALYFQDPKFGFHLVQLITRRLLENCATTEALPGRMPELDSLRAKAAA